MKWVKQISRVCALFIMFGVSRPAWSDTVTVPVTDDATVSEMNPNTPYGVTYDSLVVGDSGGNDDEWHSYVKWDLSAIPPGSTINSVYVEFYRFCFSSTSSIFLTISPVVDSDWDEVSITWNTRPPSAPLAVANYAVPSCSGPAQLLRFNDSDGTLAGVVQSWLDGDSVNRGLRFYSPSPESGAYQVFSAKEDGADHAPKLVIDFTPPDKGMEPELVVQDIEVLTPMPICTSDGMAAFEIRFVVENVGTADSVATMANIGINDDGCDTTPLGTSPPVQIPSLSPGETMEFQSTHTGDNIGRGMSQVVVQFVSGEGDCAAAPVEFQICPDIELSNVTTDMSVYEQGNPIQVVFDAHNLGSIPTMASDFMIILSDDQFIGNDDYPLGSFTLASIDLFDMVTTTETVMLPANGIPPGDYYIGVHIEDDGGFNDMAFTSATIHINDFCLPADLVATEVSAGASAYSQGDTASVSFNISNDGCVSSDSTSFAVVFSVDQSLDPDDLYIEYLPLPALDGMQAIAIDEIFTIPTDLTPGEYFFGIDVSASGFGGITFADIPVSVVDCSADLSGDGDLSFFDVSAFLSAYSAQDPIADFTGDGMFNFFDISAFLTVYQAGCP